MHHKCFNYFLKNIFVPGVCCDVCIALRKAYQVTGRRTPVTSRVSGDALGGVGFRGIGSPPALEYQELNSGSLFPVLPLWHRLVGLVVKASTSRAEDPRFESHLRRDFFGGRVTPVT